MVKRATKLRLRRGIKKKRQQVEDIGLNAEQGLETHFFKRLSRLMRVWRFTTSWILLLALLAVGLVVQVRSLDKYYLRQDPAPGGTFTEGIIGSFTTANPLYATSAADSSVSRLVFSGLMRYDANNKLVPDLAESMTPSSDGRSYTVTLREGVRWHDGHPLTIDDVIFTYQMIKTPDARSPMFNTWKDVKITKKGAKTVVFELPNALSTFPESLTNGVIPKHKLGKVEPLQFRTAQFNTVEPIGTGPFKWEELEVVGTTREEREEVIGLTPNQDFYRRPPRLGRFIIRTFRDEDHLVRAYESGNLTSMVGLASVPDNVREVEDFKEYNVPLTGAVMVFFKTETPPLEDVSVRRALVQSVNTREAVKTLGYPVKLVDSALLSSHLGYDRKLAQLPFNVESANKYLDKAGWKRGADGIRQKRGKPLTFSLYAQNTSDYSAITQFLQKSWKDVGVKVDVLLQDDADIQGIISRHDYQALLYGVSIGPDPDVFAYWHGSQANPSSPSRLNLSEYRSGVADDALEAGRTRINPEVRVSRYQTFMKAWRDDAPALGLYQPTLLYVTRGEVYNFEAKAMNDITGRYVNVENWMIRQEKVIK